MLNQLLHGPAGFDWGVRASAFLSMGLLAIANALITTRLPNARTQRPPINIMEKITDVPYMVAVAGYVWSRSG